MGTCLPVYGKKQGEHCSRDTDCDSGFLCIDSGYGRSCQTPVPGDKGLGRLFLSAPGEARALVNLTFSPPFPNTFANCPYIFFLTIPHPLGPLCPVRASTCQYVPVRFLTKRNWYVE